MLAQPKAREILEDLVRHGRSLVPHLREYCSDEAIRRRQDGRCFRRVLEFPDAEAIARAVSEGFGTNTSGQRLTFRSFPWSPHLAKEVEQFDRSFAALVVDPADLLRKRSVATLADGSVVLDRFAEAVDRLARAAGGDSRIVASDDYRHVRADGQDFEFTATQAAAVKVLHDHAMRGTPDVGEGTVLERIDSESSRLRDVFRGHPAWGTLIVRGATKGTRRLDPARGALRKTEEESTT